MVDVVLASRKLLNDVAEEDDGASRVIDGLWDFLLGEDGEVAGRIYVYERLTREQKWDVYWHELIHAVNDIALWDKSRLNL